MVEPLNSCISTTVHSTAPSVIYFVDIYTKIKSIQ